MARKIIQLTHDDTYLVALCDDGTLWIFLEDGWEVYLDPIPQKLIVQK